MGYRESLAQIEGNLTDYYTRDISSARQMQSSTDHRATINKLAADIKVGKGGGGWRSEIQMVPGYIEN